MKHIHLFKKSRTKLWFVLLLALQTTILINAQSLPNPVYTFPLDSSHPEYWVNSEGFQQTGAKHGTFQGVTDRFGVANGATKFLQGNSYVFQGDYYPVTPRDVEVTISFWTKMETSQTYPTGSTPYIPGVSMKERFFSLDTDYKSGGLARLLNTSLLGVERTVNVSNTLKPWYLWLYETASMAPVGWYHIVMVAAANYTKVYIYKPDGTKSCSYNYMGNNDFAKKLLIGKRNKYSSELAESADIMDDLKFWNIALTEQQIEILRDQESVKFDVNELSTYSIRSVGQNNQYVTTNNFSIETGANIITWPIFANYSKWYFQKAGHDINGTYYNIISKISGKRMLIGDNSTTTEEPVLQGPAIQNLPSSYWYIEFKELDSSGKKIYRIRNKNSNKYMFAHTTNFVSQWPLDDRWPNRYKWLIELIPEEVKTRPDIADGTYRITSKATGFLFGYLGNKAAQNIWDDNDSKFNITYQGFGRYRLQMKNPAIDNYLARRYNGYAYQNLSEYEYLDTSELVDFYIREMGKDERGKFYRIDNQITGKSATAGIEGDSYKKIDQYDWVDNADNNQKWYVDEVVEESFDPNVSYKIVSGTINCNDIQAEWYYNNNHYLGINTDAAQAPRSSFNIVKRGDDRGRNYYTISPNASSNYVARLDENGYLIANYLYTPGQKISEWYIDEVRKASNGLNLYRISSRQDNDHGKWSVKWGASDQSCPVTGNGLHLSLWRDISPSKQTWLIRPHNE